MLLQRPSQVCFELSGQDFNYQQCLTATQLLLSIDAYGSLIVASVPNRILVW